MVRYVQYIFACQWYCVRLLIYAVHSFFVFLSKPGARIIVPVLIIIGLYLARTPVDAAVGRQVDQMWLSVVRPIMGASFMEMTAPLNIEITALVFLLLLFFALMMLAAILQPVIGALWAPRQPIPPMLALQTPDTTVNPVPVKRLLKRRKYPKLSYGLADLSGGLSPELQAVLQLKPQRARPTFQMPATTPTAPPSAPQTGAPGSSQPPQAQTPRPAPPAPPAPPPVPPQSVRPATPPPPRPPMPPNKP